MVAQSDQSIWHILKQHRDLSCFIRMLSDMLLDNLNMQNNAGRYIVNYSTTPRTQMPVDRNRLNGKKDTKEFEKNGEKICVRHYPEISEEALRQSYQQVKLKMFYLEAK